MDGSAMLDSGCHIRDVHGRSNYSEVGDKDDLQEMWPKAQGSKTERAEDRTKM